MYLPYLRGRQFELIAIRELIELNLIGNKIIPIIEPVKASSTLLKTIEVAEKAKQPISIIINPKVGSFNKEIEENRIVNEKYFQILSGAKFLIYARIVDENIEKSMEFLESFGNRFLTICTDKDMIPRYESVFKDSGSKFNLIPDETGFRRRIRNNRVMMDDKFNKLERNVDYFDKDEPFSEDHLFFKDDEYLGFSDYSIVGNEYSESGFAPYAVAIHIVYFDSNSALRVKHFVSDSNDDITDIAGKFKEAMEKLVLWNNKMKLTTYGIKKLEECYHNESYPGLGTVKKLTIMHHLELMNLYLQKV